VVRVVVSVTAAFTYALFLAVVGYAIGFVGNFWPVLGLHGPWWRTMDGGPHVSVVEALLVDFALVASFGVQHSVMARQGFKRWSARFVPAPLERTLYVMASNAVVALLLWQWRPLGAVVWDAGEGPLGLALVGVSLVGWLVAAYATFLIDHAELFGLKQALRDPAAASPPSKPFVTPGLYRAVRHPLYLGFLTAFWASPKMTVGHLVFAGAFTAYVLIAVRLEERDLVAHFGKAYEDYRRRVPAILPFARR
jgi:methanethiol S-methyltransferase